MSEYSEQMAAWQQAQQQFWQQMLSGQTPDFSANAGTPLAMVELIDRLASQASEFQRYGESLLQQASSNNSLNQNLDQFVSYIQQQQTDLILRRWQLPEQIIALFKSHSFRDELIGNDVFTRSLKSLLESQLPGITAAQRATLLEGTELLSNYQKTLRDYLQQYNQIGLQARDRLRDTIENSHPPISSLAELHEHWTHCYETAYSDTAFSPGYQQAYGDISNALMKLQRFVQQWRDEQYEKAGLVSLSLFDQLLKQQAQFRKALRKQQKENAQLRQQVMELQSAPWQQALNQMQQQIDGLQNQLDQLNSQSRGKN